MSEEWDDYRRVQVRRWLKDVKLTVSTMRSTQNQLRAESEAYDMMKGIAYDSDGIRTIRIHGDDSIVEHIMRIKQCVSRLEEASGLYADKVGNARKVFASLTCHQCAGEIMAGHYIVGWTWGKVADDIAYSEQHVKRIAEEATLECYDLMPHEWRDPAHQAI